MRSNMTIFLKSLQAKQTSAKLLMQPVDIYGVGIIICTRPLPKGWLQSGLLTTDHEHSCSCSKDSEKTGKAATRVFIGLFGRDPSVLLLLQHHIRIPQVPYCALSSRRFRHNSKTRLSFCFGLLFPQAFEAATARVSKFRPLTADRAVWATALSLLVQQTLGIGSNVLGPLVIPGEAPLDCTIQSVDTRLHSVSISHLPPVEFRRGPAWPSSLQSNPKPYTLIKP